MSMTPLNKVPAAPPPPESQPRSSRQGADFLDTLKLPIAVSSAKQGRVDGGVVTGVTAPDPALRVAPPPPPPLISDVRVATAGVVASAVQQDDAVPGAHAARGTALQPRVSSPEVPMAQAWRSPGDNSLTPIEANALLDRGTTLQPPDGKDVIFARLFPFGLVANRYLSEWIAAALPISGVEATAAGPQVPTGARGTPADVSASGTSAATLAEHPGTTDPSAEGFATHGSPTPESGDDAVRPDATSVAEAAVAGTADTASATIPVRAMWTSPSPEGGWTLWLRDYRVDADQAAALADGLARAAHAAGRPLQQIYLNGRRVWLATNHQGA